MNETESDCARHDLIVVPARFGSTRLPGKPLLKIAGRTLLERVVANAVRAAERLQDCSVLVATDDERIGAHAESLGVRVVMTAPELDSGSSRAHAAASQLAQKPTGVINLQGDAPFISPEIIAELIAALRAGDAPVVTPVYQLDWDGLDRLRRHKLNAPFSGTTCVRSKQGNALWFSKNILPALRDEDMLRREPKSPVWQHLGLYAYSFEALDWFVGNPQGHHEILESLEQLRFLENGWRIATVAVDPPPHASSGIDTQFDIELAEQAIARFGDPYDA